MKRFTSDNGKSLVEYLINCKRRGIPGPVIFLGAGTSVASGIPITADLLKNISVQQRRENEFQDFDEIVEAMNEPQLNMAVQNYMYGKAPSFGHRLLAQLMARGYFDLVLTTNWDNLLEQSLFRFLPHEKLKVFSRTVTVDQTLAEIISRGIHGPTVIKLHGDLSTRLIMSSNELLLFQRELLDALDPLIRERGLIIIGYSMQEPRMISLTDAADNNKWFVKRSGLDKIPLKTYGFEEKNIISNEEAEFDVFMECIASGVLFDELAERQLYDPGTLSFLPYSEKIDSITHEIKRGLLADSIQDEDVVTETLQLFGKFGSIPDATQNQTCLVFINDPGAPGGLAMHQLVMRSPEIRNTAKNYSMAVIKIEGRTGEKVLDREVVDIANITSHRWEDIKRVILVDQVSFTASTLLLAKKFIEDKCGVKPENFAAAVLRLDRYAERVLQENGVRTISNAKVSTSRFSAPWGVTRPTSLHELETESLISFNKPLSFRLFLPNSSFLYNPKKPWGYLTAFTRNTTESTRILFFERFQRTSLHFHLLRDEIFIGLDDEFILQLWDKHIELTKHQAILVPAGVPHRLIAQDVPSRVLEIALGEYEDQKDIFRLEDIYGRPVGWESDGIL